MLGTLSVMEIAALNQIMTTIITFVKALENARGSIGNAMEPALMKEQSVETACACVVMMIQTVIITALTTRNAMVLATVKQVFMTAMEHALISGGNLAMESVLRDLLSVVEIATVNLIMTTISMFVKALENASQRQLPVTTPVPWDTTSVIIITAITTAMKDV